jgi:hypothetical protein
MAKRIAAAALGLALFATSAPAEEYIETTIMGVGIRAGGCG